MKVFIAPKGSFTGVDELAAELAVDQADLKTATEVRSHEAKDFAAEDMPLDDASQLMSG